MALSTGGGSGGASRRRRGRGRARRQPLSEINVTPLVDVMLVLLIIFMISAPLLTVGVPVELPKTEAVAVKDNHKPVSVTVKRDGSIYVQESLTQYADLTDTLKQIAGEGYDQPIFVRADGGAPYEDVARVMAKLSTSGFAKIDLITDTAAAEPRTR
jgi:biopolymer transport protein TolR